LKATSSLMDASDFLGGGGWLRIIGSVPVILPPPSHVRLWRVQRDGFTVLVKDLGALNKNTVTAAWH
jgi:hypothetical protein